MEKEDKDVIIRLLEEKCEIQASLLMKFEEEVSIYKERLSLAQDAINTYNRFLNGEEL